MAVRKQNLKDVYGYVLENLVEKNFFIYSSRIMDLYDKNRAYYDAITSMAHEILSDRRLCELFSLDYGDINKRDARIAEYAAYLILEHQADVLYLDVQKRKTPIFQ